MYFSIDLIFKMKNNWKNAICDTKTACHHGPRPTTSHEIKFAVKHELDGQLTCIEAYTLSFLSFSQSPPPSQNAIIVGEEGWPPPFLLPTSLSHRTLVIYLMSLDPVSPVPFPLPPPPPSTAVFPLLGSNYLRDDLAPAGFAFLPCLFSPYCPFCSSFPR